jgi:hypothetical protein
MPLTSNVRTPAVELVTVTFDRVFDIVHTTRNRVPCTEFGFEAGTLRKYAVAVPGMPKVEVGITITAVLKKSGDWQSLLGWVNHQTDEIACRSIFVEAGSFMAALIGSVWAFSLWGTHPIFSLLVLCVAGCFLMGGIVGVRDAMKARALLVAKLSYLAEQEPVEPTVTQSSNPSVKGTSRKRAAPYVER